MVQLGAESTYHHRVTGSQILVVDDDPTVVDVMTKYLDREGFVVASAGDGPGAVEAARRHLPDLILLDLMLPGMEGLEVLRLIRLLGPVPVVMLTANGEEEDRVTGLELGADDYVVKPFSPREVTARVKAVLNRAGTATGPSAPGEPVLRAGELVVDVNAREVCLGEEPVSLTPRELDLLVFMMRHPHVVLRREELMEAVWGWAYGDTATRHCAYETTSSQDRDPPIPADPDTDGVGRRLPLRAMRVALAVGGIGLAVAWLLALALGDSLAAASEVVALAAGASLVLSLTGAGLMVRLRNRPLAVQIWVEVMTMMLGLAAGVVIASWRMFLSPADTKAVLVILVAAGTVGSITALAMATTLNRAVGVVAGLAASLDQSGQRPSQAGPPQPIPTRELSMLASQLSDLGEQLHASARRERSLDASRRELVAWVSHDLRTPLAGIRAMSEALEDGVVSDPDTVGRYHRTIRAEVERLTGMVDDLFRLSRIHAGLINLQVEPASLSDLVSDAVSLATPVAQAKGVRHRSGPRRRRVGDSRHPRVPPGTAQPLGQRPTAHPRGRGGVRANGSQPHRGGRRRTRRLRWHPRA